MDEKAGMVERAAQALRRLTNLRRIRGLPVDDLPPLDEMEATIARRGADTRVRAREAEVAALRREVEARRGLEEGQLEPAPAREPGRETESDTVKPTKKKGRGKKAAASEQGKGAAVTAGTRRYERLTLVYSDGSESPVDQRDRRTFGPNDIGRDVSVDETRDPA
jgi:hypothetical protein